MPAVLWSTNDELRITSAEGAALRDLGIDAASLLGATVTSLVKAGTAADDAHRRALAGETVRYGVTFRAHEFAATVGPLLDDSGGIVGIAGVAIDVTAQRDAEQALRESEERYRSLFKANPVPMWAYDVDTGAFRFVNNAAVDLYGYTREEFGSLTPDDLRPSGEVPRMHALLQSMQPDRQYFSRWLHRKKNGEVIEVEAYDHMTTIGGNRVIVAAIVDVTERNRVQEQRDRYHARLQEVSRRLVTLQEAERRSLAVELHDRVGQSLSALGIQLALLESTLGPAPAKAREILRETQAILLETGDAVRGVIAELRPEALQEFGLGAALRTLSETTRRRFGFRLEVSAPEEDLRLPPPVEAALYRICQEAIANAARHAGAKRVAIIIRARARGAGLCIADDGRGFDPAALRGQVRPAHWGLLMMRERADSVGATLRVRSAPGEGTAIHVKWNERRRTPRSEG
jgi:PAS domain S-box-containing protein